MSANDNSFVAALPDFLTWQAGTDLVRSACSLYVQWSYNQLRAWSSITDSNPYDAALSLPRPSQQRLLIAPQSFRLLMSSDEPEEEQIDSLWQFIRTEQYLCDQRVEYPAGSWTALGDYYLPLEKPPALPAQAGDKWSADRMFKASTIGNIVLDAFSPTATVDFPSYFGEVSHHSIEEVEIIKKRLENSLELIDGLSRTARLTVGSSAQVISVSKSLTVPDKIGSVSLRTRIGRMGLINLHSDRGTIHKIANAIVHESIHSLIYKLELITNLYTDLSAAHRIPTVSPWSGRELLVHSFVHACFVWYGLYNFWKLSPGEEPAVARLRSRALSGFTKGSPLSALSPEAYEVINPDIRDVIEAMHSRVMKDVN